jgi:hypothetical protein
LGSRKEEAGGVRVSGLLEGICSTAFRDEDLLENEFQIGPNELYHFFLSLKRSTTRAAAPIWAREANWERSCREVA